MTLPAPLQFSCPPAPGESLHGYLLRFMAANRHDKLRHLKEHSGVHIPQIWYSAAEFERLRAMCNLDPGELEALAPETPRDKGTMVVSRLMGHDVPEEAFVRDLRRICPHCVARDGIHRAIRTLRFVRHCPEHNVILVTECPNVKCKQRKLNWFTPAVDRCRCGTKLVPSMATRAPRLPMAEMALQGVFNGSPAFLGPYMEGMEFDQVYSLIWLFASVLSRHRHRILDDSVNLDLSDWMNNGLLTMISGPKILTSVLTGQAFPKSKVEARRVLAVMGDIVARLEEIGPRGDELSAIVEPIWTAGRKRLAERGG